MTFLLALGGFVSLAAGPHGLDVVPHDTVAVWTARASSTGEPCQESRYLVR